MPKAAPTTRRAPRKRALHLTFHLNGADREVVTAPPRTLLETLREDCGLTGTKHGCELGECGTCTILVDGQPVLSCLALSADHDGAAITTVEGLAGTELHPLQQCFADCGAAQCGYCTPGFLVTAKALLDGNPRPTREEIRDALAGNLCRCTGYLQIYQAVEQAAAKLRGEAVPATPEAPHGR